MFCPPSYTYAYIKASRQHILKPYQAIHIYIYILSKYRGSLKSYQAVHFLRIGGPEVRPGSIPPKERGP